MKSKIRLVFTSAYFLTGLLIVVSTQILGCTGTRAVRVSDIDIAQVDNTDQALEWYKQEMLKVNLEGLAIEEQTTDTERSQRTLAELHFNICGDSSVYYHCVQAADVYGDLVKENPGDWMSRAYLGSSYALKARDYPVQGLWLVIPGPGFVRLFYLQRAASHLNAAVSAKPNDPIIRLIRGSTFIGMPGKSKVGKKDMELLLSWVNDPSLNAEHAELLKSPTYTNAVFYEYATHVTPRGKTLSADEARPYWHRIALSEMSDHPVHKLAKVYVGTTQVSSN